MEGARLQQDVFVHHNRLFIPRCVARGFRAVERVAYFRAFQIEYEPNGGVIFKKNLFAADLRGRQPILLGGQAVGKQEEEKAYSHGTRVRRIGYTPPAFH